jgi:ABC-type phosphate transport system substrate-binding protein
MRNRVLIVGLLLAAAVSAAYATEFAVVVHPANPVRSMSLTELAKILKGKSAMWPTGRNITVVLRDPSTPAMRFFVEKVLAVGPDEAKTILSDPARKSTVRVVFAESDEEIVKFVGANAAAIGIVDVYNITGSVKVIKVDDKQPFDPGYVLKGH